MKYLMLIWAGLWRNKTRTALTMISMIVSFVLFGVLQSLTTGLRGIYRNLATERLFIENRLASGEGMPIAYFDRIREVPGVTAATHWTFFGGFYQDPRNSFTMFATDIAGQFATAPKLKIPQSQYENMLRTRDGLIVSQGLAARYGWKIGDRVPLGTSIWSKKGGGNAYDFQIMGIMDVSGMGGEQVYPVAFMHFDYLDEARSYGKGVVGYYIARIGDGTRESEISSAIDARFANSAVETKSQSEQSWTQAQLMQFGDVQAIAQAIVGAVLFTLLFLTANTMMQSVRDRIPEIGVLKAIGFSDRKVLLIIVSESLVLCITAMFIGLALATATFKGLAGSFGNASLPPSVIVLGIVVAIVLALVSAAPPALRAARLNVVDTLAGR